MYADPNSFESISKMMINAIQYGKIDPKAILYKSLDTGEKYIDELDTPMFCDVDYVPDFQNLPPSNLEKMRDMCSGMETCSIPGLLFCITLGPAGADMDEHSVSKAWVTAAEYVRQWNEYVEKIGFSSDQAGKNKLSFALVAEHGEGTKIFTTVTTEILSRL